MESSDKAHLVKAGTIAKEVIVYARSLIKKGMPLLTIAESIEKKIIELGGKPAFPVNLSINDIAAHATPSYDDTQTAHGLLKVDIGVHIDGWVADTAFSLDLEQDEMNKKLIHAAENALRAGVDRVKLDVRLSEIGSAVEESVKREGFNVVRNLTGHAIDHYDVHAGVSIPNYDTESDETLDEGIYAIEPFTTNGAGKVVDGKPSGIYQLVKEGNVRDAMAREVLGFIAEEYQTLPFCSRWIHKKFGGRGLLGLRFIEQAGLLHHYPQLVERGKGIVAQAEHTFLVEGKEKLIIA
jgi:methionyl aminopeptidase